VQSSALNIAVPLHVVPAHSVFHYWLADLQRVS
jgi:hypothetical protein